MGSSVTHPPLNGQTARRRRCKRSDGMAVSLLRELVLESHRSPVYCTLSKKKYQTFGNPVNFFFRNLPGISVGDDVEFTKMEMG